MGLPLDETFFKKRTNREKTNHPKNKTFAQCSEAFIKAKTPMWKSKKLRDDWHNTLQTYTYPTMGELDADVVSMEHVFQVLQSLWEVKTMTASRLRARIETVLDYAHVQGWRKQTHNPARWKGLLDKVLPPPKKVSITVHHKALRR